MTVHLTVPDGVGSILPYQVDSTIVMREVTPEELTAAGLDPTLTVSMITTDGETQFAVGEGAVALCVPGAAACAAAGQLIVDAIAISLGIEFLNEDKDKPSTSTNEVASGTTTGAPMPDPDDDGDDWKKNPTKSESDVWRGLKGYKKDIKTNGQVGKKQRFYKWDYTHNDIEVYAKSGKHLGSMDPVTGKIYKPPVVGRTLF